MSSRLEQLPDELLLRIGKYCETDVLEVCQNRNQRGVFEVLGPGWKGLRSLRQASSRLCGPATDAHTHAKKNLYAISINLFRPRTPCTPTRPFGHFRHRVPDSAFLYVDSLELTVPLYFISQDPASNGFEVLIACTMKFERMPARPWFWSSSDFHYLVAPTDSEEASLEIQYRELHIRMWTAAVMALNVSMPQFATPPGVLNTTRIWRMSNDMEGAIHRYQASLGNRFWNVGLPWLAALNFYRSVVRGTALG